MKKPILIIMCLTLLLSVSTVLATPFQDGAAVAAPEGKKMSFQGTLYENGAPVTGERNFTFSINLGEGESWTETQSNVQVIEGLYAVTLGSVTPMPSDLFYGAMERVLTVSIGNTVLGNTTLYSPFATSQKNLFNDSLMIQGGHNLNLYGPNPADSLKVQLNYYEPNRSGSVLTFGHNKKRTALIGESGDLTGGLFHLSDSLGRNVALLKAHARIGDWVTDKKPHGSLILNGPDGQNFYLGAKVWEEGGANRPAFHMYGSPVEDPNNEGNSFNPEGIFMSIQDFGDGQQGFLQLGKVGENSTVLNKDLLDQMVGLVDGQGKYRFSVNEQNSGSLKLLSSVDSVSVLIDSNGEKAGLIQLKDSLGRNAMDLIAYPGNASQLRMFAPAGDNGQEDVNAQTTVSAQYVGGVNPFINLIGRNSDGTARGRAQAGSLAGNQGSGFRVTDPNFRSLINIEGNADNGGQISIEGPSSSNFWIGQKNWEDSNLPFMGLRGAYTEGEGDGTYNPDLLQIEVNRDFNNGVEFGQINFGKTTENGVQMLSLNYDELNNLLNNNSVQVGYNHNDTGLLFRLDAHTEDNNRGILELFGSTEVEDGNGGTYLPPLAQLISEYNPGNNSEYGEMRLGDQSGKVTVQLRGEGRGEITAYGENGNKNVELRGRGDGNFGMAEFYNSDGQTRAELGSFGDDSGFLQLFGPNSSKNIQMGGSDANRNLGMLRLSGTSENNLVNLEVIQDAGNTEYGTVNIGNTQEGGFEIGSRSWENNGLGGNRTYTAIRSTIDVDDGNGGTYRPWVVSQEFHEDGNGNQFGTIRVNSTNNTGFANINDGNSGNIDISGSFNQSSDARLKKNVSTITSGLSIVHQLRGVRYNWKDESRPENKIGFIAQEVETVLPELVHTRENGFKGVNYAEMTAVLVEAVKELSAEVEALKAENSSLKAEASKVEAMEDRLAKIEALLLSNQKVNANQK